MKRVFTQACLALGLVLAATACNDNEAKLDLPLLNQNLEWYGSNREALNDMVVANGVQSAGYEAANRPLAIFDFDNTMIKNDIGDQTTFYMINHNLIHQPAGKDWSKVSPLLSADGIAALKAACDSQGEPGQKLITDQTDDKSRACADEIFSIYDGEETTGGKAAFTQEEDDNIQPAYALTVQLQAGYTPDEIRKIGADARDFALNNAVGAEQVLGTHDDVTAYVRRYAQIEDLIKVLQNHGFDVWVVSASSQYAVEPIAGQFGVNADHVVGVRAVIENGKATALFQGCGDFAEGNGNIITFRAGKRCWINKAILGKTDAKDQVKPTSELTDRFVFSAGDSDTDVFMVKDAQNQLVLNRNKPELMCNAYYNDNGNGHWLINPMFIKPKSQVKDGYVCGDYGIPNQVDSIF